MDALTINQQTNLIDLVGGLKRSGRYHIGPCPFCGGVDRFNVKQTDEGQLWHCRGCGDGKYQDAVSFLMRRDNLTFAELIGRAAGQLPLRVEARRVVKKPSLACPPDRDWQAAALEVLAECCHQLHIEQFPVWGYLEGRGITPEAAFAASLGFNPKWRELAPGCRLAPGVTIPCLAGGEGDLWYVQVRTTKVARAAAVARGRRLDKYHALGGSRLKALYGADKLLTARTAVVTEGEFDALLLGRFLPPEWAAVTMGSAGSLPDNPLWLRYFAAVERVYLVMDNDAAGETAVNRWCDLLPGAALAAVPEGHKDITAYYQAGGDLAAWVASWETMRATV